ncbi:MAG: SAVED domain-containing protein [Myxococcota bacterium]
MTDADIPAVLGRALGPESITRYVRARTRGATGTVPGLVKRADELGLRWQCCLWHRALIGDPGPTGALPGWLPLDQHALKQDDEERPRIGKLGQELLDSHRELDLAVTVAEYLWRKGGDRRRLLAVLADPFISAVTIVWLVTRRGRAVLPPRALSQVALTWLECERERISTVPSLNVVLLAHDAITARGEARFPRTHRRFMERHEELMRGVGRIVPQLGFRWLDVDLRSYPDEQADSGDTAKEVAEELRVTLLPEVFSVHGMPSDWFSDQPLRWSRARVESARRPPRVPSMDELSHWVKGVLDINLDDPGGDKDLPLSLGWRLDELPVPPPALPVTEGPETEQVGAASEFLEVQVGVRQWARRPVTVPLAPTTLLAGDNGAGKTTIVEAAHQLFHGMPRPRLEPPRGAFEWCNRRGGAGDSRSIRALRSTAAPAEALESPQISGPTMRALFAGDADLARESHGDLRLVSLLAVRDSEVEVLGAVIKAIQALREIEQRAEDRLDQIDKERDRAASEALEKCVRVLEDTEQPEVEARTLVAPLLELADRLADPRSQDQDGDEDVSRHRVAAERLREAVASGGVVPAEIIGSILSMPDAVLGRTLTDGELARENLVAVFGELEDGPRRDVASCRVVAALARKHLRAAHRLFAAVAGNLDRRSPGLDRVVRSLRAFMDDDPVRRVGPDRLDPIRPNTATLVREAEALRLARLLVLAPHPWAPLFVDEVTLGQDVATSVRVMSRFLALARKATSVLWAVAASGTSRSSTLSEDWWPNRDSEALERTDVPVVGPAQLVLTTYQRQAMELFASAEGVILDAEQIKALRNLVPAPWLSLVRGAMVEAHGIWEHHRLTAGHREDPEMESVRTSGEEQRSRAPVGIVRALWPKVDPLDRAPGPFEGELRKAEEWIWKSREALGKLGLGRLRHHLDGRFSGAVSRPRLRARAQVEWLVAVDLLPLLMEDGAKWFERSTLSVHYLSTSDGRVRAVGPLHTLRIPPFCQMVPPRMDAIGRADEPSTTDEPQDRAAGRAHVHAEARVHESGESEARENESVEGLEPDAPNRVAEELPVDEELASEPHEAAAAPMAGNDKEDAVASEVDADAPGAEERPAEREPSDHETAATELTDDRGRTDVGESRGVANASEPAVLEPPSGPAASGRMPSHPSARNPSSPGARRAVEEGRQPGAVRILEAEPPAPRRWRVDVAAAGRQRPQNGPWRIRAGAGDTPAARETAKRIIRRSGAFPAGPRTQEDASVAVADDGDSAQGATWRLLRERIRAMEDPRGTWLRTAVSTYAEDSGEVQPWEHLRLAVDEYKEPGWQLRSRVMWSDRVVGPLDLVRRAALECAGIEGVELEPTAHLGVAFLAGSLFPHGGGLSVRVIQSGQPWCLERRPGRCTQTEGTGVRVLDERDEASGSGKGHEELHLLLSATRQVRSGWETWRAGRSGDVVHWVELGIGGHPSHDVVLGAEHAVACADAIARHIFKRRRGRDVPVRLFMAAPVALACALGRALHRVGRIRVMDYSRPHAAYFESAACRL